MTKKITAAIVGYGNLGRSAEKLVEATEDFELFGVFSRRENLSTDTGAKVYPVAEAANYADQIDVLLLCLGSATDIPEQAPGFAEHFTTVDTYDNHSQIPAHYARMDEAARASGHLALISTGWDPGLFSMNRTLGQALFPAPVQNTFWGKGLSQGHSDAIRRVAGVKRGVQYTIPREDAIEQARAGQGADIVSTEAHARVCYIVADEADQDRIREEIVNMPDYFAPYQTTVNFISDEEFDRDHAGMPHGGHVITTGQLNGTQQNVEFTLELESNPDFTAAAMIAFARAAARLAANGETGARSVLEVPLYLLHPADHATLLAKNV